MKKSVLLVVLLCVCLLLPACKATDPDNLFEMPLDTEATEPKEFITYTGTYPYGNMQMSGGVFLLLDNKVIFSHIDDGKSLVYAYDLNTEEVQLYCSDATCMHKNCTASELGWNLEVYQEKLYALVWPFEDTALIMYPAVANGNTPEILIEADAKRFLHHEDKLYIHTADKSLVFLEEGKTEPQMVMEEFTGERFLIIGEYLYSQTFDGSAIRVHLTEENPKEEVILSNVNCKVDEEHIYYWDRTTALLYRCNLDGSDPEPLLKEKIGSNNFDDEYFYYILYTNRPNELHTNDYDIYRFPKDDPTKAEKIATLPMPVGSIYTVPGTGKLFVENYRAVAEDEYAVFVLNTDGSGVKKLEFPEYGAM